MTTAFVKVPSSVLSGDVFTVNVGGETHYIKCRHSMTSSRLVKLNTASKSTSIVLSVTVPEYAIPGDTFLVRYNDKFVSVRCPLNATPGSQIVAVIDK